MRKNSRDTKQLALIVFIVFCAICIKVFAIGAEPVSDDETNKLIRFLNYNLILSPTPTPNLDIIKITELESQINLLKAVVNQRDVEEAKKQKVISSINSGLGGVLKNKGAVYYAAGKTYNVNAMLMAAISIHETRTEVKGIYISGTSAVCINYNNVAGINRRAGMPYKGRYCVYNSIDEGIKDFAVLLKKNYIDKGRTDINTIGNIFCPLDDVDNGKNGMDNASWIPSVTKIYLKILKEAEI